MVFESEFIIKFSRKWCIIFIFENIFFVPYGDFSYIKLSIRNPMDDFEIVFYYNIFFYLKRSNLRWAASWFLKKVTNQLPLMSSIHFQDRKTLIIFKSSKSDKGIHVIIGIRAWPFLNGGSLEIIIVYLTSLKNRHV